VKGKLTDAQIQEMRQSYAEHRESIRQLAERFEMTYNAAWLIIRGIRHKEQPRAVCPHCRKEI
jgi:hypothetical protein